MPNSENMTAEEAIVFGAGGTETVETPVNGPKPSYVKRRMSISLPPDIYSALREIAHRRFQETDENVSMNDLILESLGKFVKKELK